MKYTYKRLASSLFVFIGVFLAIGMAQATDQLTPPPTPGNVAAVANSPTQITVYWTGDAPLYRVDNITNATNQTSTATSSVFTGLTCGAEYSFGVLALNNSGAVSPTSSLVSATTQACAVSGGGGGGGDVTSPRIWLADNKSVIYVALNDIYLDSGAEAWDDADEALTDKIITSKKIDTQALGVYQINYEVSDKAGNKASISREVRVVNVIATKAMVAGNLESIGGAGIGKIVWQQPKNAGASDDIWAIAKSVDFSTGNFNSNYLKATNFGFNIPSAATIVGIKAEIERNGKNAPASSSLTSNYTPRDRYLILVKNGVIDSLNTYKPGEFRLWTNTDKVEVYGGSSDTWEQNWTPADINNKNFGFALAVNMGVSTVRVDSINITVYYTDTEAPVMTLNGEATVNLNYGEAYNEPGVTITDNYDQELIALVGGEVVNSNISGSYHITYNVTDSSGNSAGQLTRTVVVGAKSEFNPAPPEEYYRPPQLPYQDSDRSVMLSPGWNSVSAPRLVAKHIFSAAETSDNFDVFVLNANAKSGWSTMADLGQSEFVPLYGYFINNKTGQNQFLYFYFKPDSTPAERLFERVFGTPGWYSIGVANPTYAAPQCSAYADNDNPAKILSTLEGKYGMFVDFGDQGEMFTNADLLNVGLNWASLIPANVNTAYDLRDMRGYAVYITEAQAKLIGSQNIGIENNYCRESLWLDSIFNGSTTIYPGDKGVKIGTFRLELGEPLIGQTNVSLGVTDIYVKTPPYFPFKNLRISPPYDYKDDVEKYTIKNPEPSTEYHFNSLTGMYKVGENSAVVDIYADALDDATPVNNYSFIYLRDVYAKDYATQFLRAFYKDIYLGNQILSPGPKMSIVKANTSTAYLSPGDLIKIKGKPTLYALNKNLEVMSFPDSYVFKSWVPTYSGYINITQAQFDSLKTPATNPTFIVYRSGTHLVKRESSNILYVVEPGNTLAEITPLAAEGLYGVNYTVKAISTDQWDMYVNMGAKIDTAVAHPGMLVSLNGKKYYVTTNNKLREITDAGWTANKFQDIFVKSLPESALVGLTIDENNKINTSILPVMFSELGEPAAAIGGALTVAVANDNPFAATIVSDSGTNGAQAMIPVLKLVFTAGADGDVKVTSLNITRGGSSADTDISNMYLYDGETKLAGNPTISDGVVTFTNNSGLFTALKNAPKTITVKMDIKNAVTADKTFNFSVDSQNSVTSDSTSVGGLYPLTGNTFSNASVADLGKLVISSLSPAADGFVDPGASDFEAWKIQLAGSNQDVEVRKLTFTIVGSVNVGDLQNFALNSGGVKVGDTVAGMAADKTVTFDLSAAPFTVAKGQTRQLSLVLDVVDGTNRNFYASIQNSSDVITYDKNYNIFLKTNGSDSFSLLAPTTGGGTNVSYIINSGYLTQSVPSSAPTGNIADGATNVLLGKFKWKANGEDIKISSLSVSSTASAITRTLANVRLLVDGSQVGTTISSLTADGSAATGWGAFGNSFIIKAGTTAELIIIADITDGAVVANDIFVVGLSNGVENAQGVVSLTSISSIAQNGNPLTVKGGEVAVALNSSFGNKFAANPNGTVNAEQALVGSFVITAGAGDSVDISQIQLADNTAPVCAGAYLQNLTLKTSAGKQLGATIPSPTSTCSSANTFTFNISPALLLTAGEQLTVNVYADLKAAYTTGSALLKYLAASATGHDTGTSANDANPFALQSNYISGAGNFMVQVDANTPLANNYIMGQTDQTVAKFVLTASSTEMVNITQLVLAADLGIAATGTIQNIRLWDLVNNAQIGNAVASLNNSVAGTSYATSTYSYATFTGLNLQISAGGAKQLGIKVDFITFSGGGFSATGQALSLGFTDKIIVEGSTLNPFTATGASSGSSLTATVSRDNSAYGAGGYVGAFVPTSTLYRAKLTVAWSSDTPTGVSSANTAMPLAKVVITNLQNAGEYPASVTNLNFNFGASISQAAGVNTPRELYIYKDSYNGTQLATTNFVSTQRFTGATAIADDKFTDVEISSGQSMTFYVTLDTTDASVTNHDTLSVRIPSSGITWTDGISTGLTAMGGINNANLPLVYKTMSF